MLANNQVIAPAGAATIIARPNTNRVLSKSERTNILPICGFLYGGSSKEKEDGTPFKTVDDKSLDTIRVANIPISIMATTDKDAKIEL